MVRAVVFPCGITGRQRPPRTPLKTSRNQIAAIKASRQTTSTGIYGGPARAGTGAVPGMVTSLVGYRREEDDREGLLALVSLPREAVVAFHREVRKIVMDGFAPEPVRSAL
ncbi:uncharacterized protein A4U43_C01F28290 [Asparagus officinalis]|uniref:Uncharacterized protein n=1 Tax=Asparagus officinalis TaxID=4686 RepID=A0A5P1FV97_ASPOF|nr:uncharacterized protein A4U43_C01F28290 [Asparagus officinalis]